MSFSKLSLDTSSNEWDALLATPASSGSTSPDSAATRKNSTQGCMLNLFKELDDGNFPEWLVPTSTVESNKKAECDPPQSLEALSPKDATAKVGIFEVFPSLSYDEDATSDEELDIPTTPDSQSEILKTLKEFHSQFTRLKFKWTKAFQEINGSHL